MRQKIKISRKVREFSKEVYRQYYATITDRWRDLSQEVLLPEKAEERIEMFAEYLDTDLKNKKILEIGSGLGMFVLVARLKKIKCYGIEPDEMSYQGSVLLLKQNGFKYEYIKRATGERLPYRNDSFDFVVAHSVLEHVGDVSGVIKEAVRVLKPGGKLCFVTPNYNSFWESHYGIYWWPRLPKFLGKIYVRILGRGFDYLDSLNFITPDLIREVFVHVKEAELDDMGSRVWADRMVKLNFKAWGQSDKVEKIAKLLKRLNLTRLAVGVGLRLEFYYPLIILAKKKIVIC